jgi:hypothetical protein
MHETSCVWAAQADDSQVAHLARVDTRKALCAEPVGSRWTGEPTPAQRCGECELLDMAERGIVRIKGLREGTLAAF